MMKKESSTSVLARVSKTLGLVALGGLLVGGIMYAPQLRAEEKKSVPVSAASSRLAVLDITALMRDSNAAKSIRGQVETHRNRFQAEIKAQEEKLRVAEKDLLAQRGKLKQPEFDKRRQAFEKQVLDAQKSVQLKRGQLEKAYAQAMAQLRDQITKLVADMAASEKIGLVLARDEVVIVDATLDITKPVMASLNSKISTVSVKF
jgi:outer membrane protein